MKDVSQGPENPSFSPSSPRLLAIKADSFRKKGHFRKAEALCYKILLKEPYNQRALLTLASVFIVYGNMTKVEFLLNRILEQKPQDIDILKQMAELYLKIKNNPQALKVCDHILSIDPSCPYALFWKKRRSADSRPQIFENFDNLLKSKNFFQAYDVLKKLEKNGLTKEIYRKKEKFFKSL